MSASEFTSRLPASATEEKGMIETAFAIVGNFAAKASEIRANNRLSEAGKLEDVKAAALGGFIGHLNQIKSRAAAMTADITNLQKACTLKAPDRTDLFGESQRQEIRALLRTMSSPDRFRLAAEDDAVGDAVLHAPAFLSGISVEQHEQLREARLERLFGSQRRGAAAREEVVATVNAALSVATSRFHREAGITEKDLAA